MSDDMEQYLLEIERQCRLARGEEHERDPWQFKIPTAQDLRNMREKCGLTEDELADITGYSEHTIAAYERGRSSPGREYIVTVLRAYRREWPREPMGWNGRG